MTWLDPLQLPETAGDDDVRIRRAYVAGVQAGFDFGRHGRFRLRIVVYLAAVAFVLGLAAGRAVAAPRPAPVIPAVPTMGSDHEPDLGRTGAPSAGTTAASPTPAGADPTSAPATFVTRQGIASTYGPGWDGWIASPFPRGTVLEICGLGGCATRTTNDVGPNQRIHPDRVVDLDVPTFELVCGVSWRMGLCPVTVTMIRRG